MLLVPAEHRPAVAWKAKSWPPGPTGSRCISAGRSLKMPWEEGFQIIPMPQKFENRARGHSTFADVRQPLPGSHVGSFASLLGFCSAPLSQHLSSSKSSQTSTPQRRTSFSLPLSSPEPLSLGAGHPVPSASTWGTRCVVWGRFTFCTVSPISCRRKQFDLFVSPRSAGSAELVFSTCQRASTFLRTRKAMKQE